MLSVNEIKQNLTGILENIEKAAEKSGRKLEDVRLIGVTKTQNVELVKNALKAGIKEFGENYVQEALEKINEVKDGTWHFIGHLQSNKAKFIPGNFTWIQTIHSPDIISKLDKRCIERGLYLNALIEVNIAKENTKSGVNPEDVERVVEEVLRSKHLKLKGLMCLPPFPEKPEDSRKWFVALRELREKLIIRGYPEENLQELSMGTTDDYRVGVEEGATMVRIGRALFGERKVR